MTQAPENPKNENRWWEFYFVRYFVGTAIGAIIVLFLATAKSPLTSRQGDIASIFKILIPEKLESANMIALTAVGLAFCYIASAPILVLHATRGSLLKFRNAKIKPFATCATAAIALSAFQIHFLWSALSTKVTPWSSAEFYTGSLFLLTSTTVLVLQFSLLWVAMSGFEQNSFEYYKKLVRRRASADAAGKEYIESYRHLREHGNAFLIVIFELLLGAAIFYSPVPWGITLMLWIFPACLVWAFGTMLESRNF